MGFNPFIQVFYFYIAQWRECCAICSSFNPFIQVFYFYRVEQVINVQRHTDKF